MECTGLWLVLGLALLGLSVGCSDDSGSSVASPANQLSAGGAYNCTARADRTSVCWGRNDTGQSSPVAGAYASVSSAVTHTCGLGLDGNVTCWGTSSAGESSAPTTVDVGTPGTPQIVPIRYGQITAGVDYGCGVVTGVGSDSALNAMATDRVVCWGLDVDRATGETQTNDFGQAECNFNVLQIPPDVNCRLGADVTSKYKQVSGAYFHTCAIRENDTLLCWGRNDPRNNQSVAPPGVYSQLSTGLGTSCAICAGSGCPGGAGAGDVVCWGGELNAFTIPVTASDQFRKVAEAPAVGSGPYSQVSVGVEHVCAVRGGTGDVVCWGSQCVGPACTIRLGLGGNPSLVSDPIPNTRVPFPDGRTAPPGGAFSQVSAGAAHTCGIRPDGKVECWGNNGSGQTSVPPGAF